MGMHEGVYLSLLMVSDTAAIKLRQYVKGASSISSPPLSKGKEKAPFSATMLSPTMLFAIFLCLASLDQTAISSQPEAGQTYPLR